MNKSDIVEKQIRNIRGASHFILVMTPGCLDEIIQVNENSVNKALGLFLIFLTRSDKSTQSRL